MFLRSWYKLNVYFCVPANISNYTTILCRGVLTNVGSGGDCATPNVREENVGPGVFAMADWGSPLIIDDVRNREGTKAAVVPDWISADAVALPVVTLAADADSGIINKTIMKMVIPITFFILLYLHFKII